MIISEPSRMRAQLEAVKTNCLVYVASSLKRNPDMLGDDDDGWMKVKDVKKAIREGEDE
jgi:hypothetical protein